MSQEVYLARKGSAVIFHTDQNAMKDMDGVIPEKTVSLDEWEAAGGLVRIINGEIVLGKTETELETEAELTALLDEVEALQRELTGKDYKVVKAAESGQVLKQTDPALHQRREWCRSRINEIRSRIAEIEQNAG